ncbi:uncharacterized protein LOC134351933 [Mobula hypostoma]|uniref:uncharacterized protein LOC134351933 n=1 Tax=Mobula hypostoma TaxID=723540 RepID=UPI002FC2D1CE
MGSSKQLPSALKIKMIDAHKAGEGYKKIAKRFQVAVSSVRNVIKKWQFTGTVEVKLRSGRPRKFSERTVRRIARKANHNPHFTAVDLRTLTPQTLSQQSAAMGSSKQLPSTLKINMIDAHKAGEGYKKIAKRFQVAVSSVRNVIKKWQLTGTVEVKLRSGRPRKLSERTVRIIARKANENPRLTAKDLQEDLADSGVVVHCSTVQRHLHKYDSVKSHQKKTFPVSSPQNSVSEVCKGTSKQA